MIIIYIYNIYRTTGCRPSENISSNLHFAQHHEALTNQLIASTVEPYSCCHLRIGMNETRFVFRAYQAYLSAGME